MTGWLLQVFLWAESAARHNGHVPHECTPSTHQVAYSLYLKTPLALCPFPLLRVSYSPVFACPEGELQVTEFQRKYSHRRLFMKQAGYDSTRSMSRTATNCMQGVSLCGWHPGHAEAVPGPSQCCCPERLSALRNCQGTSVLSFPPHPPPLVPTPFPFHPPSLLRILPMTPLAACCWHFCRIPQLSTLDSHHQRVIGHPKLAKRSYVRSLAQVEPGECRVWCRRSLRGSARCPASCWKRCARRSHP